MNKNIWKTFNLNCCRNLETLLHSLAKLLKIVEAHIIHHVLPSLSLFNFGARIHSLMGELIPCDMHLQIFGNGSTILIWKGSPQLGVFHNTLHSWWHAYSTSEPAHKDLMVSPLGMQDLGNHKRCGAILEMLLKLQIPSFSLRKKGTRCFWFSDSSKEYATFW